MISKRKTYGTVQMGSSIVDEENTLQYFFDCGSNLSVKYIKGGYNTVSDEKSSSKSGSKSNKKSSRKSSSKSSRKSSSKSSSKSSRKSGRKSSSKSSRKSSSKSNKKSSSKSDKKYNGSGNISDGKSNKDYNINLKEINLRRKNKDKLLLN